VLALIAAEPQVSHPLAYLPETQWANTYERCSAAGECCKKIN